MSPVENVTETAQGTLPEAKVISAAQLLTGDYESQYVAVENVQVVEADLGKTWVTGGTNTSITIESATGETFVVYSARYSDALAAATVPDGSGTLKGIAQRFNDNIQIMLASTEDYAGLTGERFGSEDPNPDDPVVGAENALIISEYMDGSGQNKYLELANISTETVDLTNYKISIYANGKTTATNISLSGTLDAGKVIVYRGSQSAELSGVETISHGSISFNGNDVIAITYNGEIVDILGTIGSDENFAADKGLRRISSVTAPSATYNTDEWEDVEQDDVSGFGTR